MALRGLDSDSDLIGNQIVLSGYGFVFHFRMNVYNRLRNYPLWSRVIGGVRFAATFPVVRPINNIERLRDNLLANIDSTSD